MAERVVEGLTYERDVPTGVDRVVERLGAELKDRGFGVLATLRIHDILQEKIGKRVDPLVILEVCSPTHAFRGISSDRAVATLLPCKIVVGAQGTGSRIFLQRPTTLIRTFLADPPLRELADEVELLLRQAVDAVR